MNKEIFKEHNFKKYTDLFHENGKPLRNNDIEHLDNHFGTQVEGAAAIFLYNPIKPSFFRIF